MRESEKPEESMHKGWIPGSCLNALSPRNVTFFHPVFPPSSPSLITTLGTALYVSEGHPPGMDPFSSPFLDPVFQFSRSFQP